MYVSKKSLSWNIVNNWCIYILCMYILTNYCARCYTIFYRVSHHHYTLITLAFSLPNRPSTLYNYIILLCSWCHIYTCIMILVYYMNTGKKGCFLTVNLKGMEYGWNRSIGYLCMDTERILHFAKFCCVLAFQVSRIYENNRGVYLQVSLKHVYKSRTIK